MPLFSRRRFLATLAAAAAAAPVVAPNSGQAAPLAPLRPNIVFILADDLGYGDLGCYGHPYAKTPAIDRLAREGTLFRGFYVSGATCNPSRTGLMTGRFPATFAKYPASYGFSGAPTLTQLLSRAGYKTGHFGKWHLGPQTAPGTYGIDVIQEIGGNRRDPRGRDAKTVDAALGFIQQNKDAPFYVNIWCHGTHAPIMPPQTFVERFASLSVSLAAFPNPEMQAYLKLFGQSGVDLNVGMRTYLGDVSQLDDQVDRVLKTLDELKLRPNTLVVFSSDNGPGKFDHDNKQERARRTPRAPQRNANEKWDELLGSPGPFRARKHSLYDGGIRLPFIVSWPGRVAAGRKDETSVLAGVDWLPSVCALAGVDASQKGDGEDVSDIWLNKPRARRTDLFWKASSPNDRPIIRRGNWKLHQGGRGQTELYDLASDPGERQNVAARHPDVVAKLGAALKRWNATLPTSYLKGVDKED